MTIPDAKMMPIGFDQDTAGAIGECSKAGSVLLFNEFLVGVATR